jgi:hypothetical protein
MGVKSIHPRRATRTPCAMATQIQVWRENVIDLDIVVDDKRRDLSRVLLELREAVGERDRAAAHLGHLIDAALHSCAAQPAA